MYECEECSSSLSTSDVFFALLTRQWVSHASYASSFKSNSKGLCCILIIRTKQLLLLSQACTFLEVTKICNLQQRLFNSGCHVNHKYLPLVESDCRHIVPPHSSRHPAETCLQGSAKQNKTFRFNEATLKHNNTETFQATQRRRNFTSFIRGSQF